MDICIFIKKDFQKGKIFLRLQESFKSLDIINCMEK